MAPPVKERTSTRDMTPAGQTMVQQPQGTQPHQAKVWRDEFAQFNKPDNSLGQSQQQGHHSWEPTKTNQPKTSKSNNNTINRTHLDIIPMGNCFCSNSCVQYCLFLFSSFLPNQTIYIILLSNYPYCRSWSTLQ